MKYCRQCRREYEDSLERCPDDGARLVSTPEVTTVGLQAGAADEGTRQLARDIEDLILKMCTECHTVFTGDTEVCPEHGKRLVEPSLITRDSLVSGHDGAGTFRELKKHCPACNLHFDLNEVSCEECGGGLTIPTFGGPTLAPVEFAAPDSVIADKYRILSSIGSGGFGDVYLAKHESLGKRCAVKVVRGEFSDAARFRNRFHQEALKLSRLEDEHIVRVFDFGESEGLQYMVTEYVEGTELNTVIYEDEMPPLRAAKIMRQVARALCEAHSKNIVHLDLKPRNILVTQKRGEDLVKVIDFGLAELYSEAAPSRQRSVAGTSSYMAPEQWRRGVLEPRTDIYSFGVILYEVLAGRPPFRGTRVSELEEAHLSQSPPPLQQLRPDVPAELEKLAQRCMEKQPENRIPSAEELESRLDSYVRRTENVLGRWMLRAGVATAIVLVSTAVGWAIWDSSQDRTRPKLEEFALKEPGLFEELERTATPTKTSIKYWTRESEATLLFRATDENELKDIKLDLGLLQDPRALELDAEGRREVSFTLKDRANTIEAWAVDSSGNESKRVSITIDRRSPPVVQPRVANVDKFTKRDSIDLVLALNDATARIVCRRKGETEPHFDVTVETLEAGEPDARYRFSGRDAASQSLPEEGADLKVLVRLKPGVNTIAVSGEDALKGGSPLFADSIEVHYEDRGLDVDADIEIDSERTVRLPDGRWLTSESEALVSVAVQDAENRLQDDAVIQIVVKSGADSRPHLDKWDERERRQGQNKIAIPLSEGENQILIPSFSDRFRHEGRRIELAVVRDRTLPSLEIRGGYETVKYFQDDLPRVRFEYRDEHPAEDPFSLKRGESQVDAATHRFASVGDGVWELEFLDDSLISSDGRIDFRIEARDRVRNRQEATFSVLVDRNPPEITGVEVLDVAREALDRPLRRGDRFILRIQIRDRFLDAVDAKVEVSMGAATSRFAMHRVRDTDFWERELKVKKGGVGDIEKPERSGSLRPGFHVTFTAGDHTGPGDPRGDDLRFAWENGDELSWERDDSILVFHEEGGRAGDRPVRAAFFIQKTEVSNIQYRRFLATKPKGVRAPRCPEDWNQKTGELKAGRENLPVRGVSPFEARQYALWAGLDLPLKDQWLVAAFWDYEEQGPRVFPWPSATDFPPVCASSDGHHPAPVDDATYSPSRTPEPFGLFHMFGNVWEIVLDEEVSYRIGGGFRTPLEMFQETTDSPGYLRGREKALSQRVDLGFRCVYPRRPGAAPPKTRATGAAP